MLSLRPRMVFHSLAEAAPALLAHEGLRAVLLDVDNTLIPYGTHLVHPDALEAVKVLNEHFMVILISNNREKRVSGLAEELGVEYVANAMKPFPWGVRLAIEMAKARPDEVAMIGDQLFTDILGANWAGCLSVLTNPQGEKDFPLTKIMRMMEFFALRLLRISRKGIREEHDQRKLAGVNSGQ